MNLEELQFHQAMMEWQEKANNSLVGLLSLIKIQEEQIVNLTLDVKNLQEKLKESE